MKNKAFIIAFTILSSLGYSQSGPKINFKAADNTLDYGTIKKNNNGVRSLEFTNSGDAPLLITNVLPTSGFTVISKPSAAIAPGKSSKIDIKYNMVEGPIRKTIAVEYNATNPNDRRVIIKVKGEVIAN